MVLTVTAAVAMTTLAPLASYASSEGNRNTAIGLAGVAAYLLVKGKTLPGIAAAAGAGYAYSRSQKERDEERYRDSRYRNDHRWDRDRDNRDQRHSGSYRDSASYSSRDWHKTSYNNRDNRYHDADYGRGPAYSGCRR